MNNQTKNTQQYVVYGPSGRTTYRQTEDGTQVANTVNRTTTTTVVYQQPVQRVVQPVVMQYPAVYQQPPVQQPATYQQPMYQQAQAATVQKTSVYKQYESTEEKKRGGLLWLILLLFIFLVAAALIFMHFYGVFTPKVSDLSAPTGLKANGYSVSWEEVRYANGYIVDVSGAEYETNRNGISLSSLPYGEYEVKVKAVNGGNRGDSAWSNVLKVTTKPTLSKPVGIYTDGSILRWDAVPDATGYWLFVDGKLYETSTNQFDLSSIGLPYGSYTIKIMAKAPDGGGFADSEWIEYNYTSGGYASKPGYINIGAGRVLSWDAVPGAIGYIVRIDGEEFFTDTNSFNISFLDPDKTYRIEVKSIFDGSGTESDWTDSYEYSTGAKLNAPSDIVAANGFLYWTHSLNADSYIVDVDGQWFQTRVNYMPLFASMSSVFSNAKDYKIRIFARSNSLEDSEWSEVYTHSVKRLTQPVNVRVVDGVLGFNFVQDAQSYLIDLNGEKFVAYENYLNVSSIVSSPGMYTIRVQAVGNGWTVLDSEFSAPLNHNVVRPAAPENLVLNQAAKTLTWNPIANIAGYLVDISGEFVTVTTNSISLSNIDTPNIYVIKVKALGNGGTMLDSDWSETRLFTVIEKPATPTGLSIENNVLLWDSQAAHPLGYFITINGVQYESSGNTFDLSTLNLAPGTYTIRVKAKGNAITQYDSDWSADITYVVVELDAPGNIVIDMNAPQPAPLVFMMLVPVKPLAEIISTPTLRWDAVDKAEGYEVDINGTIYPTSTNILVLSNLGAGDYEIKIRALGNDIDVKASVWSAPINFTIHQLSAPNDVTLVNTTLTWTAVPNVQGYMIKVGEDEVYLPYEESFAQNVSYQLLGYQPGTYIIRVRSIGNDTWYLSSDYPSEFREFVVSRLDAPTNLKITVGTTAAFTWNSVVGATGYQVLIGSSVYTYGSGVTSHDLTGLGIDRYIIRIKALGNNGTLFDSGWSEASEYEVTQLAPPSNLNVSSGVLTWIGPRYDDNSAAMNYIVDINGVHYDVTGFSLNISSLTKTAKTYSIRIKAVGDYASVLSSEWSATYSYNVIELNKPTVTISGSTVSWTKDSRGTNNFLLKVNNGTSISVSGTSYSLSGYGIGSYSVTVMQKGNGAEYLDSAWSSAKTYTVSRLSAPVLTISNKVVSWAAVPNASSYAVYKNNKLVTTTGSLSYTITDTAVGTYAVYIIANGNGVNYLTSTASNTVTHKIEAPKRTNGCVIAGTKVTLADGSTKNVENLTGNEFLLVWDFLTGKFTSAPIQFVKVTEKEEDLVFMKFADGTTLTIARIHGLFDATRNEFVYITYENAEQFVGHKFNMHKYDSKGNLTWTTVQLTEVSISRKTVTVYNPVTFRHLSSYLNGVLTMPADSEGITNIFEVNAATMQYDMQKYYSDIMTYGLFTYEELRDKMIAEGLEVPLVGEMPRIMFDALNGQYFKIAIAKGLLDLSALPEIFKHFAASLELHQPIVY